MSVEIRNVSQLTQKLRRLPDAVREAAVEEIQATGIRIRDNARARVPVDSGDLRASIVKRRRERGLDAIVGPKLFYGLFVEFGTKAGRWRLGKRTGTSVEVHQHPGTPARPFLHPAAEEERKDFPQKLARRINEALANEARR